MKPAMFPTFSMLPKRSLDTSSGPLERARSRADTRRGGDHSPVDYRAFVQPPTSWINWSASLLLVLLLVFTTVVNLLYFLRDHNVVTVEFPEVYAADREWLFGEEHTGAMNLTVVLDFIRSDNMLAATQLKSALLNTSASAINASTPCVSRVGPDAGSFYAFCDQYDATAVPEWARDFDALIIQTIYLATVEQHNRSQRATPFVGIAQGFRNNRTGWYKQETISRLYCMTKQLAGASKETFTPRVLFTKAHGVLRNVDCAVASESSTDACRAINNTRSFVLFDDGTGILHSNEVVRTESGKDLILSPYTANGIIGQRTSVLSSWPMDDCLYVRGGSIGWLGAGISTYHAQIPALALAAKLQLIGMVLVVWLIKFQCALYRAHHALYELSRLGAFVFLVAQLLFSAYFEQDIMRSMYSWKRNSDGNWLLFLYIESTIALASALLALLLLRMVFYSSMCQLGASITTLLPVVVGLVEIAVAQLNYTAYSVENGLLARPSLDCPVRIDTCTPGTLNRLHIVFLLAFLPVLAETLRVLMVVRRNKVAPRQGSQRQQKLTTFEKICLDECYVDDVVLDCSDPYVNVVGIRHVSAGLVSACGFTIIHHRFVIRTKDLVYLVMATVLPERALRDFSIVLWPLRLHANGSLGVMVARRMILSSIRYVMVGTRSSQPNSSLLRSDEHPLS